MTFLDTYKKYVNSSGSNPKDSLVNAFIRDANDLMKTNPSYFEVSINDSAPISSLIVDDSKVEYLKAISLAPGNVLKGGDYIKWDDELWLTLIVDHQGSIYYRGSIKRCNAELKWIDNNGEIQSSPCVFEHNTRSNFGVRDDKFFTMPDARRQVIIQKNEHTEKLGRKMRYLFDGAAYVTIDFDALSDEGLVNITLKDDEVIDDDDNVELGIANYKSRFKEPTPSPPDDELTIVINGSDSLRQGQTLTYTAQVYNNSQEVTEPVTFTLYADNKTSTTSLAVIQSQDGYSCVLRNNNSNNGYVQMRAIMDSDNTVIAWKRIQMRGLI